MEKKVLLLMALLIICGCDNVPGQYRHDKNHHQQQDQKSSELDRLQRQK
ncbi:MAG: hypothetical protein GQ529_03775 [Methyloprofundus sp.]|nr:hypothetical protein [Methyloprofundus sp.]